MFIEDNFTYLGEFKDFIPHGQGMLIKGSTKERFIGAFLNGKLDGAVRIISETGSLLFEGDFKDGKQHGHGISFTKDG